MSDNEWPYSFGGHQHDLFKHLNGLQSMLMDESLARAGRYSGVDIRISRFIQTLETLKALSRENESVKAFCYVFKRDGLGVENIKCCFSKYGVQTKATVERKQKEALRFILDICKIMLRVLP